MMGQVVFRTLRRLMDMRFLAALLVAFPLLAAPVEVKFALNGYFVQRRPSKPINVRVPRNQLSLVALPEVRVPYGRYDGFRVVLANDTGAAVTLTGQDMRLDIIREARDASGAGVRWSTCRRAGAATAITP